MTCAHLHARARTCRERRSVEADDLSEYYEPEHSRVCDVQISKHARHPRVRYRVREWGQPTLRLPFRGIRSPNRGVAVGAEDIGPHDSTCRYVQFVDRLAIYTLNWDAQREDGVLARPMMTAASVRPGVSVDSAARTLYESCRMQGNYNRLNQPQLSENTGYAYSRRVSRMTASR